MAWLVCSSALPPPTAAFLKTFTRRNWPTLTAHGWTVRSARVTPALRAQWGPDSVGLVATSDPKAPATKHWLRLQARTDGRAEHTVQAQICHQRKFLKAPPPLRVRLSDAPVQGADGDVVVQAFYLVSPLRFDFDPSSAKWTGNTRPTVAGVMTEPACMASPGRPPAWNPGAPAQPGAPGIRSHGRLAHLILQVQGGRTRHIWMASRWPNMVGATTRWFRWH